MKKWLILLLISPILANAGDQQAPKDMVNTFFVSVIKGNISSGYDQLFQGSTLPVDKPQALISFKQQTKTVISLYGKLLGYKLIKEEKFGKSLVKLLYILKSEKKPTIWEFYFYKPKNSWFLVGMSFYDQYQQILQ